MRLFFSRLLKVIFYPLFLLNMAMLLLSLVAAYFDPKNFWPPSLIKLFFVVWLAVHVFFLLVFIFRGKKRKVAVALVVLLLSLSGITKLIALHPYKKENSVPEKGLKLMSYNVMGFHWWHRREASKILHIIKEEEPDIICMQEYMMNKKDKLKIRDTLTKVYGYKYYRQHFISKLPSEELEFGEAIFSKIPIHNFTPVYFGNTNTNGAFYVDVPVNNNKDTFRLINLHFESYGLLPKEYNMPDSLNGFTEQRWYKIKLGVKKLRTGFRKKSYQMEQIKQIAEESPYKVIICGDFNETSLSYIYRELTSDLNDAFLESGSGFGSTFAGKLPLLRIDYILLDPSIKSHKTYIVKKKASDHYPLVSFITLEE